MARAISYDSLTLRAVIHELRHSLEGGQVQHVAQPTPTDLGITIRSRSVNHTLLLSCDASFARVHLTHVKRPNPSTPPAFCMLLRKHLEGTRVRSVAQRGFDRILDLVFVNGEGASYTLVAELMGKHSNVLLLSENGRILDAAKRITRKLSRLRETLPGCLYVPPPAQEDRADPFAATSEEIGAFAALLPADPEAQAARLMGHYAGLSPFLTAELLERARQGSLVEAWQEVFGAAKAGDWLPVVVRSAAGEAAGAYPFPTVQFPSEAQHPRESVNLALDHYFSVALPRAALHAAQHELETSVARAIKTRERQRESLQRSLEEVERAEQYKQTGELLLANLHNVEPEADSVTVIDYYAPEAPERTIPLDPQKSPRENADVWFRRYRKARDGAERQQAYLEQTRDDLAALLHAQTRVKEAKDLPELRALKAELTGDGLLRGERDADETGPGKRGPDFDGKKIRVIHTPEGWDIYVGENSEANDYLTSRVAAPNDLWLHVRANASAHVVVRTRNAPGQVPQSVLKQAALLAARHSAVKHSSLVPVDYTLKKYVRRPRGSASGAAVYTNEKTLYVSLKE